MAKKDYYEVLGVAKSATPEELKRAYRKLAMQHHPDKHGGDDSQFKEINEAYGVLSDQTKRAQYDRFGHAAAGAGAGPGGAGFNPQDFGFDFSQGGGFGDIFDMFFRGGGTSAGPTRGQDIELRLDLDFREAVFGVNKPVSVTLDDSCDRCEGSAAEPGSKLKTCSTCKGMGQVTSVQNTILGSFRQSRTCETCLGRRQVPEKPCEKCRGRGTVRVTKDLKVKVPAGIDNGATIQIRGAGEAGRGGGKGDLYVHVRVKPDKRFERQGNNIHTISEIPMVEAALGTTAPVETLDGQVELKIPPGTQSGKVFKISGKGVPHLHREDRRGDQLVTVVVETPTRLTNRQKELLKEFAEAESSTKKRFWKL